MSFEIQETFLIKIADIETLSYFRDKLYQTTYSRVLDFLEENNLFEFEDTQTYRGNFYQEDKRTFRSNHPLSDDNYLLKRLKFDVDYSFVAIYQEKLLLNLDVEGDVKIFDNFENLLDEYEIHSISRIKNIGLLLFKFLFELSTKPTPYLENLTYKYFLKIKL